MTHNEQDVEFPVPDWDAVRSTTRDQLKLHIAKAMCHASPEHEGWDYTDEGERDAWLVLAEASMVTVELFRSLGVDPLSRAALDAMGPPSREQIADVLANRPGFSYGVSHEYLLGIADAILALFQIQAPLGEHLENHDADVLTQGIAIGYIDGLRDGRGSGGES